MKEIKFKTHSLVVSVRAYVIIGTSTRIMRRIWVFVANICVPWEDIYEACEMKWK